jgi:hypothetical protein
MSANETVQKYFDTLLASYDILVESIEKANDRGTKVTKQFTDDVIKGQRDAIELGKKLAGQPGDMSQFYTAVLEATTSAQSRALAFTQVAYQEALSSSADARETIEKLVAANRETAQAAMEAARSWSAANPFADVIRRNVEAMTPPAATKKEKAAAK